MSKQAVSTADSVENSPKVNSCRSWGSSDNRLLRPNAHSRAVLFQGMTLGSTYPPQFNNRVNTPCWLRLGFLAGKTHGGDTRHGNGRTG